MIALQEAESWLTTPAPEEFSRLASPIIAGRKRPGVPGVRRFAVCSVRRGFRLRINDLPESVAFRSMFGLRTCMAESPPSCF